MNEQELISKYADIIASKARQSFLDVAEDKEEIFEGTIAKIESPIERILCIALLAVKHINGLQSSEPEPIQPYVYINGIEIEPQFQIDKYRVDLKISNCESLSIQNTKNGCFEELVDYDKTVLVECDSQEWHERTEEERRQEKARDRYLAKKGYVVFHYTGKEILENPIKIAEEIFTFVGCCLVPVS